MDQTMRIAELERKLSNTVFVGKVAEIDEAKGCRVQAGELLTDWLPVLSGRQGKLKERAPLKVDEIVLGVCMEGNPSQGFVIGSIDVGGSIGNFRMLFEDGTSIEYDPDAQELKASSAGSIKAIASTELVATAATARITAVASAEVQAPTINLSGNVTISGTLNVAGMATLATATVGGTPLQSPGNSF